MTDTDEDMVLCGRGLDKWYGAKHERRQVLFGVDVVLPDPEPPITARHSPTRTSTSTPNST